MKFLIFQMISICYNSGSYLKSIFGLSEGVSQNLPVMKQHFDLEIFFLAVGCRPESGHVFDPIGLDPDQPEHRKRK